MNFFQKIKNLFNKHNNKEYCKFFILSLLNGSRNHIIHKNLILHEEIELFQSVNGYSEDHTIKSLQQSGLIFHNLHDSHSLRYGVLANFLTKFQILEYQIEHDIPYICFLEDDVCIKKNFINFIYDDAIPEFKKDKKLNIIRLGVWGEAYITSLASAKRLIKIIKQTGIRENIDNQLRTLSGKELDLSSQSYHKLFTMSSAPNSGDCLNTKFIDISKVNPKSIKNLDIVGSSKFTENSLMYFSQNGTDKYLCDNIFKGKEGGIFIDVGATNGINSNNTLTLDRFFDWKGILVEPSLEFEPLFTNRYMNGKNFIKSQFISNKSNQKITFGHSLSSCFASDSKALTHKQSKPQDFHSYSLLSKTLTDVFLECYSHEDSIDLLCISTNGSEIQVLEGLDFQLLNVRCILVKSDEHKSISSLLNQYNFIALPKISRYLLYINYNSLDFFDIDVKNLPQWKNLW
jgi:GR25 family glycosyltransferase involved in LPS biosynthesis